MRDAAISPFTALFIPAEMGGYCGFVAEIPGVHSQGSTLRETRENLREALEMILRHHYDDTVRWLTEDGQASVIEEPLAYVSAEPRTRTPEH